MPKCRLCGKLTEMTETSTFLPDAVVLCIDCADAVDAVGHMAAVDKEGGAREAINRIRATVRRNELEEIKQNYSLAQKYLTELWAKEMY